MTETKAMAVAALLLAGAVVRIELRKAGKADPDAWWLGHLDSIAELLLPSEETRRKLDLGSDPPAGEGHTDSR